MQTHLGNLCRAINNLQYNDTHRESLLLKCHQCLEYFQGVDKYFEIKILEPLFMIMATLLKGYSDMSIRRILKKLASIIGIIKESLNGSATQIAIHSKYLKLTGFIKCILKIFNPRDIVEALIKRFNGTSNTDMELPDPTSYGSIDNLYKDHREHLLLYCIQCFEVFHEHPDFLQPVILHDFFMITGKLGSYISTLSKEYNDTVTKIVKYACTTAMLNRNIFIIPQIIVMQLWFHFDIIETDKMRNHLGNLYSIVSGCHRYFLDKYKKCLLEECQRYWMHFTINFLSYYYRNNNTSDLNEQHKNILEQLFQIMAVLIYDSVAYVSTILQIIRLTIRHITHLQDVDYVLILMLKAFEDAGKILSWNKIDDDDSRGGKFNDIEELKAEYYDWQSEKVPHTLEQHMYGIEGVTNLLGSMKNESVLSAYYLEGIP